MAAVTLGPGIGAAPVAPPPAVDVTPEQRGKLERLFRQFGLLNESAEGGSLQPLLDHGIECALFLKEWGILPVMAGLYNALRLQSGNHFLSYESIGLKFENGEPHLRLDGEWYSWREFNAKFERGDRYTGEIFDRRTGQCYVFRDGLEAGGIGFVRGRRYQAHEGTPTRRLSDEEYETLRSWYGENHQLAQDALPTHFMEIMTSQRDPKGGLVNAMLVHNCIRLIAPRGDGADVYLFSFEGGVDSQNLRTDVGSALSTVRGYISAYDFDEFGLAKTKVMTAIGITPEVCAQVKDYLVLLSRQELSFNIMSQNCALLTELVLKQFFPQFRDVSFRTMPGQWFWQALCNLELSYFTPTIRRIDHVHTRVRQFINSYTPAVIALILSLIWEIIFFIPAFLWSIVLNLVTIGLGAAKTGKRDPITPRPDDTTDNSRGLAHFQSVYRGPRDLFTERTRTVAASGFLVRAWQLQQPATHVFVHDHGRDYPSLTDVPPV